MAAGLEEKPWNLEQTVEMTADYMRRKKRMPILIRNCLTGSEPWASEARQTMHLSINQFGDGLLIARIGSKRRDLPIDTNTNPANAAASHQNPEVLVAV